MTYLMEEENSVVLNPSGILYVHCTKLSMNVFAPNSRCSCNGVPINLEMSPSNKDFTIFKNCSLILVIAVAGAGADVFVGQTFLGIIGGFAGPTLLFRSVIEADGFDNSALRTTGSCYQFIKISTVLYFTAICKAFILNLFCLLNTNFLTVTSSNFLQLVNKKLTIFKFSSFIAKSNTNLVDRQSHQMILKGAYWCKFLQNLINHQTNQQAFQHNQDH
ncbi:hypothetical protein BLOT_012329 [Blomia tropicalis]|nr:hypothetical protein BLOT_012329 [Blomia tropicalis]